MNTISLKQLVIEGNFGGIKLGMTIDHALSVLGDSIKSDLGNGFGILTYGKYELHYIIKSGLIFGIHNDNLSCYPLPRTKREKIHQDCIFFENQKSKIDTWFLDIGCDFSYKMVKDILQQDCLEFDEIRHSDDSMKIKFNSGTELLFDDYFAKYTKGKTGYWKEIQDKEISCEDFHLTSISLFDLKLINKVS
jgi:hypothetical protein